MILDSVSKSIEQSGDLARHTWEYYKLKVFAQVAGLASILVKVVLIGGLSMIALLFFGIASAQFLGEILESKILGYVCTGLMLLLITGIAYGFRKKIENRIVQKLSKSFFET